MASEPVLHNETQRVITKASKDAQDELVLVCRFFQLYQATVTNTHAPLENLPSMDLLKKHMRRYAMVLTNEGAPI